MTNRKLNELFAAYVCDSILFESDFFNAIRTRAMKVLLDDDATQDFLIRLLKELKANISHANFSSWLNQRLKWFSWDEYRRSLRVREVPITDIAIQIEDDEDPSSDDKLDLLQTKHRESNRADEMPDTSTIADPLIRRSADLLLFGHSVSDTAKLVGITEVALKKRVQRFRRANESQALQMAA